MQGGLVFDHNFSEDNSIRALGYYGTRQVVQYLANPSLAITGSGGVVDLDRNFGGGELRWHHSGQLAGAKYELTLGAAYDRMDELRQGFVNVLGEKGELRRNEDDVVYDFDQYLIGSWNITNRWQLAGGVRHSEVNYESTDHFIVGANPDDSGGLDFDSTVPVLGVLFQATPGVHLFASWGKGFEAPTFSELAYRPDGLPGLNFALEAADSTNMITRSISFPPSCSMTSSRLPTENLIVISGKAGVNARNSEGAKYFAVLTAPSFSTPRFNPRIADRLSPASRSSSIACFAYGRSSRPAAVRWMLRPVCSNKGMPTSDSRSFSCCETAGCVRCSSSAARVNERCRATAAKARICRKVTLRIESSYQAP